MQHSIHFCLTLKKIKHPIKKVEPTTSYLSTRAFRQTLGEQGRVLLGLVHDKVEVLVEGLLPFPLQLLLHPPFEQLLRVAPKTLDLARHGQGNLSQVCLARLFRAQRVQLFVFKKLLDHRGTLFGVGFLDLDFFLHNLKIKHQKLVKEKKNSHPTPSPKKKYLLHGFIHLNILNH